MELTGEHLQTVELTVKRLLDIRAQMAELEQSEKALKSFLRSSLGVVSQMPIAGQRVTIAPLRRFDAAKAVGVIPAELMGQVTEARVSPTKARQFLPPAMYEQCLTEYDPQVRIS